MLKQFFQIVTEGLANAEREFFRASRKSLKESGLLYAPAVVFAYLMAGIKYIFLNFLLLFAELLILIFLPPEEGHKIIAESKMSGYQTAIDGKEDYQKKQKKVRRWTSWTFGTAVAAVAIVSLVLNLVVPLAPESLGATNTFTQTNWGGGSSSNNAIHPTNQSGWSQYNSASSEITAVNGGEDLELVPHSASSTQTTDTQFNGGTFSSATTTSSGSSASVKLSKALHINEYTIGASTTVASITASSVTTNSNGTWTIAFSGTPNLARLFKNDKFTDSASKAWKVLSVAPSVYKIIIVDSEGNIPTVSAPATGSGTVGRWYASISAWEAGRNADITANGRNAIERGLPYYDGAPDTTSVTINGWTTDATHYVEIYVPLSERHRGKWDDNKYRIQVANLNVINISGGNGDVRIDGLQIYMSSGSITNDRQGINIGIGSSATDVRISNSIIRGSQNTSAYWLTGLYLDAVSAQDGYLKMWNNVFYDFYGTSTATAFSLNDGTVTSYLYNNTLYNNYYGVRRNNGTVIAKNNIYQSNGISGADGFYGTFDATSNYNISDLASDAPGTNSKNATTTPFVDVSNSDFHLDFRDGTGNPAMNAGADLSADANLPITTDIDGSSRLEGGTWDVGADDVGATLVMPHSIGNSTRDFQNLAQWEDARGGFLTTRQVFRATQQAAFTGWETVTGQTSGATGGYIKEEYTPKSSLKGTLDTTGSADHIYVSGNYAYVADDTSGLQIIDISNPTSPTLAGTYNTTGNAGGVFVAGNYAYVADGVSGLQVINVSNPNSPGPAYTYDTTGNADAIYVSGNYAYVGDTASGLQIIDISNPTSPTLAGTYDTTGNAWGVFVVGNYAYVADGASGLQIIDISSSTAPTLAGTYNTTGLGKAVYVSGNYAYVADDSSGLQIINISSSTAPTLAGTYNTTGAGEGVFVVGNYAYVADSGSGLQVINIASSTAPSLAGTYDTTGIAYGVSVSGGYAYISDATSGLQIIKPLEYFTLDSVSGTFQVGETVVGATSGATSTIGAILTTQGTIEKGEAYNDSTFTAGVTIDGSTTDANHYMWLAAEPRSRHTGVAGTGAKIDKGGVVGGDVISSADHYSVIEWLEVTNWRPAEFNMASAIDVNNVKGIVRNNIIHDPTQNGNVRITGIDISNGNSSNNPEVYNNIIYNLIGISATDLAGIWIDVSDFAYNNTIYNIPTGYGIYQFRTSSNAYIKNNIVSVCGTCFISNSSWSASYENYNISSDATAPGASSLTNQATSSLRFISTATDFVDLHILDGSVAKDAGADLSATFTSDADGQTRPNGAAFDAGADEWFSSSPVYNSSGTFTSATVDFGNPVNFTTANFSRVLTSGGIGKAFGSNETGTLGNDTSTGPETCGSYSCSKTPVIISNLNNLIAVDGSNGWGNHDYHSVGLLADGTVKAWGNNVSGQLGDGTTATSTTPVTVSGISTAVAVAAGNQFSMALLANGTVKMWGDNGSGKLGDNTTTNRLTPVTVCNTGASAGQCDANPLSNVVAIAAGESFAMALLADGVVKTWGSNWEGQLGDGTRTDRNTPVSVSGITNAVAIGVGDRFAYAVLVDGTVKAWGQNNSGQLGINTATGPDICGSANCSKIPVTVCATSSTPGVCDTYLSNVVSVAGGGDFALALLSDGTMKAWGLNCSTNGCLGDGTINNRLIPVTVCNTSASAGQCDANPLTNVVAIAAGEYFSLALISDGTVKAWGADDNGQLGDDVTLADKTTPVTVSGISGATAIGAGLYHTLIVTGGARFAAAAKSADSGWQDSDYKPLGMQIGMSPTKAVFPTGFSGNRYLRYKAYLSTADSAFTPQMDDVTVNYSYYATTSPGLFSSPYNTNDDTNILGKISWTATTTSGTEMRFRVRSSPDNITWSQWCGESVCDDTDYFAAADNNVDLTSGHPLKNGGNDKWLQYKAIFVSTGASTPTFGNIVLTYVVNAPPDLQNVTASQRTSDGKVDVVYEVRDTDTATGTTTPGFITPSFSYSTDGGDNWTAITSGYLTAGNLSNKQVCDGTGTYGGLNCVVTQYTQYTAAWDAKAQLNGTYATNTKIMVTTTDNEGANNSSSVATSAFTLDVKNPVATVTVDGTKDGQAGAVATSITDNSSAQMMLSNLSNYSADGLNGSSGTWIATSTSLTWNFAAGEPVRVYGKVKDAYQNETAVAPDAPNTPANATIQDISNLALSSFREFISWSVNGAGDFGSYKVYRSANGGSNYALISTITSAATNFLSDGPGLSNGAMYYYRLTAQDSSGNISRYSSAVSDIPDGQGGTDVTSPVITNVSVSATSTAQATITWTTDELSDSVVYYSTNLSYSSSKSVASMTTSHSVTLTGLTPNTIYNFRVRSTDPSGNSAQKDASSSGTNIIIGDANVLPTADSGNGNLLLSQSALLSQTATIQSLSFYVTAAAGNLRLGIYDASGPGGGPGNKVAETAEITPTTGWNTANVIAPISLSPNTYWLAYLPSSSSLAFLKTNDDSSSGKYYSYTYGAMPATFSVSPSTTISHWSFYATFTIPSSGTNFQFTTAQGPVISGVTTVAVSGNSATVVWNTNANSDSWVIYSTNSDLSGSQTAGTSTLVGGSGPNYEHRVSLSSLNTNAKYYFKVRSVDGSSNSAEDDNGGSYYTFTTAQDVSAPVISSVSAILSSQTSTVISWLTNEPADSQVVYGLDQNSLTSQTSVNSTMTINHSMILSDLTAGATYYYKVVSADSSGNSTQSAVYNFSTTALALENTLVVTRYVESGPPVIIDKTSPLITDVKVDDVTESSATITWRTNEEADSFVEYGPPDILGFTRGQRESVKAHRVVLMDLKPNARYAFRATSADASGNVSVSLAMNFQTLSPKTVAEKIGDQIEQSAREKIKDFKIENQDDIARLTKEIEEIIAEVSAKVAPPKITGAEPKVEVSSSFAVISWVTDRPANSIVAYAGDGDYKPNADEPYQSTAGNPDEQVTEHNVVLSNLAPGTTYHFQVRSKGLIGGIGKSADFSFKTGEEATISGIEIKDITKNSATIFWRTNLPATTLLEYGRSVDYGQTQTDASMNTSHTVLLKGLQPGTMYHFRSGGIDKNNKSFFSPDLNFITEALPSLLNVKIDSIKEREMTVTWFTDVISDSTVEYTNGITKKTEATSDKQFVKNHTMTITGLDENVPYSLKVISKDEKGNEVKSSEYNLQTAKDVQPPAITNIQTQSAVSSRDKVQTIVSWRTIEPATSRVIYQEGAMINPAMEKSSPLNADFKTNHVVVFTNFKPGAVYRLRIESVDGSGNISSSKDLTILTPQKQETVIDLIIKNFQDVFKWTEKIR